MTSPGAFESEKSETSVNPNQIEMFKKLRKDPKSMSIEELEEIINRNKAKATRNNEREENKSSLNNSYCSQKNNSVQESSKVMNKLNEKFERMKIDPVNPINTSSTSPLNIFHKNLHNESINYSQNVTSSMQNIQVTSPKERIFSGYASDQQDKNYQTNEADISVRSNNTSTAASNALRAMQEKLKQYQSEIDELRKRLILEEEKSDKEREEFHNKFLKEVNKTRDIEASYRNELESIKEENAMMSNYINQQKNEIELLKTNLQILENEKDRHLEQNVMDKEGLKHKIGNLLKDFEESKQKFSNSNRENIKLKETLAKKEEHIKTLESSLQILKQEMSNLRKKTKSHIESYQKNINEIKSQYEAEAAQLYEKIKELKEKNKQQAMMIKELEKRQKETLKSEVKTIDRVHKANSNMKHPSISTGNIGKSVPKMKKEFNLKKPSNSRSKSKSKSKDIKSSKIVVTHSKGKGTKSKANSKQIVYSSKGNMPTDKSYESKVHNINNSNYLDDEYINDIEGHKKESYAKETDSLYSYNFLRNEGTLATNPSYNKNTEYVDKLLENDNAASLNQINDVIFALERNIAEMNRNYKNLLIKINVSASLEEQQILKRNANILANNLSEQSERLVGLKTRQQELLKNSLNL